MGAGLLLLWVAAGLPVNASEPASPSSGSKRGAAPVREEEMFGAGDALGLEAEMFGAGDALRVSTSTPAVAPPARDTGRRLAERLGLRDDALQIGGVVWLRAQYNALSEGRFSDFALVSPNLVDLYLDARPNERLRFFTQGRLNFDPTVQEGEVSAFGTPRARTSVQLDQLWLKFDVLQAVYLTAGKQRVRWGSGRLWNPTDFLNLQRLDPLAFFDQRLGVTLLKAHVPVESLGWNFYVVADLEGAARPSEVGAAVRAEVVLGPAEVAASFAARKDNPERYGLDISAGVGELDVRAELALLHGVRTPFFRTPAEGAPEVTFNDHRDEERGGLVRRDDALIPQLVVGAEWAARYGDDDVVILGLEYFYNDAGYADETFYPELVLAGLFTPLYVGRHYAGLSVILAAPGSWDDTSLTLSAIANLSDMSAIARLDVGVTVLTYLSVRVFLSAHAGDGELRFGLAAPIRVVAPLFEVGAALTLDF